MSRMVDKDYKLTGFTVPMMVLVDMSADDMTDMVDESKMLRLIENGGHAGGFEYGE